MTNGMTVNADGRQHMIIDGASVGFGKRLEWPDDYFSIYYEGSYQRYNMHNYTQYRFLFDNGIANLGSLMARLTRFSAGPNTIYPRGGSTFSLSLQATPPYSLMGNKDFHNNQVRDLQMVEPYKVVFKADYYVPISSRQAHP
jgi:outer membrane protein insertion porin family